MSIKTKATKLVVLATNPDILFSKKKYLFVVSHMRSRSSVLSHILGNNPEVCGYKELHLSYKGRMSLINMQIELVKDLKCSLKNKYLLDKILNNFTISDEVLFKKQPKILFLLREPEETIKSIMNMGYKTGVDWYKDPLKVTEYYCKRLHNMEQLSYRLDDEYLFVESKYLVENSDATLKKISNWLNLEVPLKKTYATFKDTGVIGFGDPLENIKSGILKPTKSYPNISVPEHLLSKANESYIKCKATLMSNENSL
ncbi:sulfotransferase family protein [Lutibacter oceani]|uniref:Sulfotransferase family protein n=1 Tax=Lutibacter oceani TaxID=1853311 RepID=A0A3D9RWN3_9FLAO|nr:sulfotransferase [Lutibacter oceani]REE81994.1 sulfotransferase family protein [Lutibacter oceani]